MRELIIALSIFGFPVIAGFTHVIGIPSTVSSNTYRIIFIVLCLIPIAQRKLRIKIKFSVLILIIFFFSYLTRILFDLFSQGGPIFLNQLIYYLSFSFLPVLLFLCSGKLEFNYSRFQKFSYNLGFIFVSLAIFVHFTGTTHNPWEDFVKITRFAFNNLNPISAGQAAGSLFIIAFFDIFKANKNKVKIQKSRFIFAYIILLSSLFVLFIANSRGPIISTALILLLLTGISFKRILTLTFLLIFVVVILFINGVLFDIIERFGFGVVNNLSNLGRITSIINAFEAFSLNPILGAFSVDTTLPDGSYPHNFFIEILMALGLYGFSLALVALIIAGLKIVKISGNSYILVYLFLFYSLNFMVSGNIATATQFFVLLASVLMVSNVNKKKLIDIRLRTL